MACELFWITLMWGCVVVFVTAVTGSENLSSSAVDWMCGEVTDDTTDKTVGLTADIRLEHPFLQVDKGLVSGVLYNVSVSVSISTERSEQLFLIAKPSGILNALPPDKICNDSSKVGFRLTDDVIYQAIFTPIEEATLNGNITLIVAIAEQDDKKLIQISRISYPVRSKCFRLTEGKDGQITNKDMLSTSDTCEDIYLLITSPENSYLEFQLQMLKIGANTNGWLTVQNKSEDDSGLIFRSKGTLDYNSIISAKKGFLLITLHSCFNCKFEGTLTEVVTTLVCNSTIDAMKGVIAKWSSDTSLYTSCYSIFSAPLGYNVLVNIQPTNGNLEGKSFFEASLLIQLKDPLRFNDEWSWLNSTSTYVSVGNTLTVERNSSVSPEQLGNILLNYLFIKPCVNKIFDTFRAGDFCTPGHPFMQPRCDATYTILVPLGYTIELTFSFLELSSDSKSAFCKQNYIEVVTDGYPYSRDRHVMARLCGNLTDTNLDLPVFKSPSNFMELKLSTFESFVSKGFCASYKAVRTIENRTRGCDYGWTSGDKFCYRVFHRPLNWSQAEKTCVSEDGHLASLNTEDISELVNDIIRANPFYDENQAFWIGANDLTYENCYEWIDGQTFNYNNWFPGWEKYGGYSAQPSDDGMSHQNCVELRNTFRYPSKGEGVTDKLYWNDRDCDVSNSYVCQKIKPGVRIEQDTVMACNRTIILTTDRPRDVITSPNFPRSYPSNLECHYDIVVDDDHRIVVTFTDFVLEESNSCEYDFLKIEEPTNKKEEDDDPKKNENEEQSEVKNQDEEDEEEEKKVWKRCGDWESKIKLLRYLSSSNHLHMTFVSDFSHGYNGFRIELKSVANKNRGSTLCDNERFELKGDRCYLLVNYPETSWSTARQICSEARAQLATVDSGKEQDVLHDLVRITYRYMSGEIFWIGAATDSTGNTWRWVDGRPLRTHDIRKLKSTGGDVKGGQSCLAIQWRQLRNSGSLQWSAKNCNHPGRFICEKSAIVVPHNLNRTLTAVYGNLTSVNYPSSYINNLHYTIKIQGSSGTRIVFTFHHLDIEWQEDCLYDYVVLRNNPHGNGIRFCGDKRLDQRSDFESSSNVAYLTFHSDYSISASGFVVSYEIVDLTFCKSRHLLVPHFLQITSPRYPHGYLRGLDCRTTMATLNGNSKLLITIVDLDILSEERCFGDYLEIYLEPPPAQRKVKFCDRTIHRGTQLMAYGSEALLVFHSKSGIRFSTGGQRGYNITVEPWESPLLDTTVTLEDSGTVFSLNFPQPSPQGLNYTQRLVAPLRFRIFIRTPNITYWSTPLSPSCEASGLSVWDPYAKVTNRTLWNPCLELNNFALTEPIWSTLNVLYIHSWSSDGSLPQFYMDYKIVKDDHFFNRSMSVFGSSNHVDSCQPNPCQHGGRCLPKGQSPVCQCNGHYTGLFCHVTWCEMNVCGEYGICNLTLSGYTCECFGGFTGKHCQQMATACQPDPCLPNGECSILNGTFSCLCNVMYDGSRCEKFSFRIPYKPLSQRMLEEPFWLGLITVFTVLVIILCVYCIKRKFADKIEKFLMDEIERSKFPEPSPPATRYSLSSNQPSLTPGSQSPQTNPKSLFSRIRKNSILSSTLSPNATPEKETSRTFSFDDILRRVHSSKKRPNNGRCASSSSGGISGHGLSGASGGTSSKEEPPPMKEEEKSRILSSLVTSKESSRRMSLDEFFRMSERKIQLTKKDDSSTSGSEVPIKETSFSKSTSPKRNRFSAFSFSDIQSIREQSVEYMSSSDSLSGEPNTSEVRADVLPNPNPYVTEFEEDEGKSEKDGDSSTEDTLQQSSSPTLRNSPPVSSIPQSPSTPSPPPVSITLDMYEENSSTLGDQRETRGSSDDVRDNCPSPSPVAKRKSSYLEVPHVIPSIKVYSADSDSSEELSVKSTTVPKDEGRSAQSSPSKPNFVPPRKYSVDLPMPKILITANMGSCDSDEISPPRTPNPGKSMMYLSPLAVISSSADRTISESNLSTSGYSSISSPGLSRCNSSSPISDELEGHHYHPNCNRKAECQSPKKTLPHGYQVAQMTYLTVGGDKTFYFPPTIACHCKEVSSSQPSIILNSKNTLMPTVWRAPTSKQGQDKNRLLIKRNSYQTTSTDDSIDDEGIGMDTIDVKIRKGEVKSARDLHIYLATGNRDTEEHESSISCSSLVSENSTSPSAVSTDANKPDLLTCSINKAASVSNFKASPRTAARKGDKAKKFTDKHRRSPSISPSGTPIKDLVDSSESRIPRNSSRTSMSGVMMSSSESDDPENLIGTRSKSQPRRQKKPHDATGSLSSSRNISEHAKVSEKSSDATSRSESNGDSAPLDSRSLTSSSSESPPSTRDSNISNKDSSSEHKASPPEKLSVSPLCTRHRLALEHASSFPQPKPMHYHHYHSQNNITNTSDETAKADVIAPSSSEGAMVLQPPPTRGRGGENPRGRYTFNPPSKRLSLGGMFSHSPPQATDSVDSSVPSDSEEEMSQAYNVRKSRAFRPLLCLSEESALHPSLKRQEAIAEDEISDDSSSETTVLLRRPPVDCTSSERSSPFLQQKDNSSSQSADISEWETTSLFNSDSPRSPTDQRLDIETPQDK